MQEHNTTVWSFLQVVLEQVKLQHPHVPNDKGTLFHERLRRSIREQIRFCNLCHHFDDFHLEAEWNFTWQKVHVMELEAL